MLQVEPEQEVQDDTQTIIVDSIAETVQIAPEYYTDIVTDHGIIRIVNEITLGDAVLFTIISVFLVFGIMKYFTQKIWG